MIKTLNFEKWSTVKRLMMKKVNKEDLKKLNWRSLQDSKIDSDIITKDFKKQDIAALSLMIQNFSSIIGIGPNKGEEISRSFQGYDGGIYRDKYSENKMKKMISALELVFCKGKKPSVAQTIAGISKGEWVKCKQLLRAGSIQHFNKLEKRNIKNRKLKQVHFEWLQDQIEELEGKFTLRGITNKLNVKFHFDYPISYRTVHSYIKNIMKFVYEKPEIKYNQEKDLQLSQYQIHFIFYLINSLIFGRIVLHLDESAF